MSSCDNSSLSGGYFCYSDAEEINDTGISCRSEWQTLKADEIGGTVTAVVLLFYMVISLPFNLLVTVTILWKKLYQQPTLILLLNLTLNELLFSITYIPMNVVSGISKEFIFGNNDRTRCHICKLGIFIVLFGNVNLHLLALLSLDRLLFIRFPLHYRRWVTVKITTIATILMWIFCIILCIPPLVGFGEIRYTSSISTCSLFLLGNSALTMNIYFEVFNIVEAFAVPLLVIFVSNVWLICIVHKQLHKMYKTKKTKKDKDEESQYESDLRKKLKTSRNAKQLKLAKVFTAVLVTNVITWIPNVINIIHILILNYVGGIRTSSWLGVVAYLLFLSQVIVHPVLQTFLIPDVKNTLLCCRRCIKRQRRSFSVNEQVKAEESGRRTIISKRKCCLWCLMYKAATLPLFSQLNSASQQNSVVVKGTAV